MLVDENEVEGLLLPSVYAITFLTVHISIYSFLYLPVEKHTILQNGPLLCQLYLKCETTKDICGCFFCNN